MAEPPKNIRSEILQLADRLLKWGVNRDSKPAGAGVREYKKEDLGDLCSEVDEYMGTTDWRLLDVTATALYNPDKFTRAVLISPGEATLSGRYLEVGVKEEIRIGERVMIKGANTMVIYQIYN